VILHLKIRLLPIVVETSALFNNSNIQQEMEVHYEKNSMATVIRFILGLQRSRRGRFRPGSNGRYDGEDPGSYTGPQAQVYLPHWLHEQRLHQYPAKKTGK